MNKQIYIALLSLLLTGCNTTKKQDSEISIVHLQESYIAKDEAEFLKQFPKEFDGFRIYFGWDVVNDKPQILYEEANEYIDYWFYLISKHKKHEKDLIKLCKHGSWEPDAVNYLQDKTINYIKENKKYNLINELSDEEAQSILFFLFDAPHPVFDENFIEYLTLSKENVLKGLFGEAFTKNEENRPNSYSIADFIDTEHYFITNIDINNDGISDKVVSADPYQGDELLLFVNKNDNYELTLKTVNFSEDGGNQIKTIKKDKNGFVIVTAFPDRGFFETHYFIKFKNGNWILTHTLYKTESGNEEDAFIYVCKVKQDIALSDENLLYKLKTIPDETVRDSLCIKEKRP